MATIKGTTGNDALNGTTGDDIFKMGQGGVDGAFGNNGNDVFRIGGSLTADDSINGGLDFDKVVLDGDYSAGLVFNTATLANIELLRIAGSHDCDLTMNDANVGAGNTMVINAGPLRPESLPTRSVSGVIVVNPHLTFDGSGETDGHFTIYGSAGDDDITGGALSDRISLWRGGNDSAHGGGGGDTITCGSGNNTLTYSGVGDSNSTAYDVINSFDADADRFDLTIAVPASFTTQSKSVSAATFDDDMGAGINDQTSIIITVNGGDLIGHTFIYIDGFGGGGGYQSGQDYIFDITGYTGTLTGADFI